MKTCTVKHRSAETRSRCPICGRKPIKRSPTRRPRSKVADPAEHIKKPLRTAWRKRDAEGLIDVLRDDAVTTSITPTCDEFCEDFSGYWYRSANVYNMPAQACREYLGDDYETERAELIARMTPIDGYVSRGVPTSESFSSMNELDEYVEGLIDSGENMVQRERDFAIREDALLSCSASPAVASCFARGMMMIYEEPYETERWFEEHMPKKTYSGYMLRIENTNGYATNTENENGNVPEREVIVPAEEMELIGFESSRESGYGMPVITYRGKT